MDAAMVQARKKDMAQAAPQKARPVEARQNAKMVRTGQGLAGKEVKSLRCRLLQVQVHK